MMTACGWRSSSRRVRSLYVGTPVYFARTSKRYPVVSQTPTTLTSGCARAIDRCESPIFPSPTIATSSKGSSSRPARAVPARSFRRRVQRLFVLGPDLLPGEFVLDPRAAHCLASGCVIDQVGEHDVEIAGTGEIGVLGASHPCVVPVVMGDNGIAGSHGF